MSQAELSDAAQLRRRIAELEQQNASLRQQVAMAGHAAPAVSKCQQLVGLGPLVRTERLFAAVLNNTRMAVFITDDRHCCVYMNAAAEQLTGYRLEEIQDRPLHDAIHHTYPDGRPFPMEECPISRAVREKDWAEGEGEFIHKDGHFYPVAYTTSPIRDDDGNKVGSVFEVRDIRARKEHQERLQLLNRELNHRIKNTLATVQFILREGLSGEEVHPSALEAIEARLAALSRSHDLLTREAWRSARLTDLARQALGAFGAVDAQAERFSMEGEDVHLPPNVALTLGMALHELATNALKYGALANENGMVRLAWRLENDRLHLLWQEEGGPPVKPPARKGFGSRLIERGLALSLDGAVDMAYQPEGVRCKLEVQVAAPGSL